MNKEIVDAVITWVDGYDEQHQQKLSRYIHDQKIERPETAAPTRYNQCGEIEYCVKSLFRYAPWIRTLYIVTDAQIPSIIQQFAGTTYENRIKLIDHRDIFSEYEHCLPTFNSVTIETMLWRIPDLAEKFIYFNDDVVLIRPVSYEDFFRGHQLVLRGKWKVTSSSRLHTYYKHLLKKLGFSKRPNLHRTVQENSAQLAGFTNSFFHLPHVPFPLKKSTFESFFLKYPETLSNNISYRLRSPHQFMPISLAHHLEIQQKTAIIDNTLQSVGVDASRYVLKKIKHKLKSAEKNKCVAFVCMQSVDTAPPITQNFMLKWLDQWTR